MLHWEIDSVVDIIAVVLVALIFIGSLTLVLLRKNIRIGRGWISATEEPPTEESQLDKQLMEGCPVSLQQEHEKLLDDLRRGQDEILALLHKVVEKVNSTDLISGALISQAGLMQKFIRKELGRERDGEEINGDLDEADEEIRFARSKYREGRFL